jgi:hypothetical protein
MFDIVTKKNTDVIAIDLGRIHTETRLETGISS